MLVDPSPTTTDVPPTFTFVISAPVASTRTWMRLGRRTRTPCKNTIDAARSAGTNPCFTAKAPAGAGLDADRRRQRVRVVDRLAERRLQLRHPGERELTALPLEIDVRRTDAESEDRFRHRRLQHAGVRQRERGADRRVTGERHLR